MRDLLALILVIRFQRGEPLVDQFPVVRARPARGESQEATKGESSGRFHISGGNVCPGPDLSSVNRRTQRKYFHDAGFGFEQKRRDEPRR